MTVYIFLYNVVAIKATLPQIAYDPNAKFVLLGSDYCIDRLSDVNKAFFHHIHRIHRNFHQVDVHEVESILLEYLAEHQGADIRLLTNEDSTQVVCAQLREKYAILGVTTEQILPYVNKVVSKNKLQHRVRTPKFVLFDKQAYQKESLIYAQNLKQELDFPMFIKPIDLVSSIGTYYIPDNITLTQVLEHIQQEPWTFEIDEFIDGALFHCDVVVYNQRVTFFMASRYANPLAQFSKGCPMGSIPVNDPMLQEQLKEFSLHIIKALGWFSSAFHIEVFQNKATGELIFLEAAARTPGALVPEMYELMFGHNLEELYFASQLNTLSDERLYPTNRKAGWITFPKIGGALASVNIPKLDIQHNMVCFVSTGQILKQANSLLDGACNVIFWDEQYQKVEQAFEQLKRHQLLVF